MGVVRSRVESVIYSVALINPMLMKGASRAMRRRLHHQPTDPSNDPFVTPSDPQRAPKISPSVFSILCLTGLVYMMSWYEVYNYIEGSTPPSMEKFEGQKFEGCPMYVIPFHW